MADDIKETTCKSCGAPVIWLTMVKKDAEKKPHIFNADPSGNAWVRFGKDGATVKNVKTYVSHWATCPSADEHRGETDE